MTLLTIPPAFVSGYERSINRQSGQEKPSFVTRQSASGGAELTVPTGSDRRGLGDGSVVFEPYLRAGIDGRQVVVQTAGAVAFSVRTTNGTSQATGNVAIECFCPCPLSAYHSYE
ncbi:MAG: hypothetical protein OEY28_01460 [Nitrospira sp.]|nr:hypothetical protein [Nitrospira sp.]